MAVEDLTRRRFVQGSAAVGGGIALGGPISAFAARTAHGAQRRAVGYGPLQPTPEEDTGVPWIELPEGFRYRIISRQGQPMSDGNPTPGIFDGMAAFEGPRGTTILIRNHENRSQAGEIPVVVPPSDRYDPDPNTRGGNTKLVVSRNRRVTESYAVLGGTHTNCAGGAMPWGTWITCEENFNYGSAGATPGTGVPHGYCFEVPADATGPVNPVPITDAGRFAHEAVAWLDGMLYLTEDQGNAAFYRLVPARQPREFGDLATFGGTLQALVVRNRPNFDANTANPDESYPVEWVTIDEPNPPANTVRLEAQEKDAAIFDRTEGAWTAGNSVYFDCTSGGEAQLGQLWQYTPRGRDQGTLKLIYESTDPDELEAPDNLVVVPATGDVFLQEDGGGIQYVRGVTRNGRIYDFAATLVNDSEFCGGCFSPDGQTFFLNQQGGRPGTTDATAAVTYAIWGPFGDSSNEDRGDDDRAQNRDDRERDQRDDRARGNRRPGANRH